MASNLEGIMSSCYPLGYWVLVTNKAIYTIAVPKKKVLELALQKLRSTGQKGKTDSLDFPLIPFSMQFPSQVW
jgi:hypothetical protein